jgi:NitT/TauT family transport system substrate-binding protein
VLITSTSALQSRRDALDRFMDAYRETIDWMYAGGEALKVHAGWLGITVENARRTRDGFFPKQALDPDRIVGLDVIVKDAVALKYTPAALDGPGLSELVQIPPRK